VQCVTLTVDVYQVFDCVCLGVVLIKHRSESQWPVLLGYLALSTNVNCYYRIIYVNFVFQQDSVAGASYIQHSPTAAVQESFVLQQLDCVEYKTLRLHCPAERQN